MARPRKLEGVQVRKGTVTRYRGTAYVRGQQLRGPWTDDAAEAAQWRQEALHGARTSPLQRLSFGDAVSEFASGITDGSIRNRSGRVFKPSVVRGYVRDLAICRELVGDRTALPDVRLVHVQRFLRPLRQKGYSDSRVRNIMVAMRSMYAWAMLEGYATTNPCAGLRLPITDEEKRERIATLEEARLLTTALGFPYRTAFALGCYAGLRAGEILALEWESIDLERPVICVEVGMDIHTGELISVKSEAAERDVPICDALIDVLVDHRDECNSTGPLFPAMRSRRGELRPGARLAYTTVRNHARSAWEGAELDPLGLHEARHTFASMLIASGASAKSIQTYMGHASITTTYDRYGHLFPGHEAEMLKLLNAYHETSA